MDNIPTAVTSHGPGASYSYMLGYLYESVGQYLDGAETRDELERDYRNVRAMIGEVNIDTEAR